MCSTEEKSNVGLTWGWEYYRIFILRWTTLLTIQASRKSIHPIHCNTFIWQGKTVFLLPSKYKYRLQLPVTNNNYAPGNRSDLIITLFISLIFQKKKMDEDDTAKRIVLVAIKSLILINCLFIFVLDKCSILLYRALRNRCEGKLELLHDEAR